MRRLREGPVPPLAAVHGPDVQLLDDVQAAAESRLGLLPGTAASAFDREVLDGREATVAVALNAAATLPVLAACRLVVVRRAQGLPAKGAEELTAYARDPNPSTCLLFLADESLAGSWDRKAHWLLGALPPSVVVALPAPGGTEGEGRARGRAQWLRERARDEGLTVSLEAALLLVERAGEDGAALLGEARKAALGRGPDNYDVERAEVDALVGESRGRGLFDLPRAVEAGDVAKALVVLETLLASEPAPVLLAVLAREVRSLWAVSVLAARGLHPERIAPMVKAKPWVVKNQLPAAVSVPAGVWEERLARCWQVENRLKSGGDARAELTALVAELCRR